jgi:hypothetical protein
MTHRLLGLAFLPFVFASCGTVYHWQEIQTQPMTIGAVYDAVEFIAGGAGFASAPECDRGLGIWTSRWRPRSLQLGRPGRFRLKVEILVDKGSAKDGWLIRYLVEQEKVKDLKKSKNPEEKDWSNDGQYQEREATFGDALERRLRGAEGVRVQPADRNAVRSAAGG